MEEEPKSLQMGPGPQLFRCLTIVSYSLGGLGAVGRHLGALQEASSLVLSADLPIWGQSPLPYTGNPLSSWVYHWTILEACSSLIPMTVASECLSGFDLSILKLTLSGREGLLQMVVGEGGVVTGNARHVSRAQEDALNTGTCALHGPHSTWQGTRVPVQPKVLEAKSGGSPLGLAMIYVFGAASAKKPAVHLPGKSPAAV